MSKRPIGRTKTLWENDVLEDIRNMNVRNWKKIAQNRDSWKKAVDKKDSCYFFNLIFFRYFRYLTDLQKSGRRNFFRGSVR
jgi:hypothetical protein